jgi:predicted RNA-binding Zn-ribbon protein involved in translation (DUF1610 family)
MALFRMTVTATASTTYIAEVEAPDEETAEAMAASREIFGKNSSEDFQVDAKDCAFDFETEQLTDECPDCGESHLIMHDDLAVCYCQAFGFNPYAGTPENPNGRAPLHPHLIIDGVCTPEPWWYEDQDYCAACGAKIEAEEKAGEAFRNAQ